LDIGAYCGYVAVYFANRFPDAEIMCVEPPGANFDALLVNTAAYANIRCLAAAVWRERTTLQWSGPVLGDWGNQFTPGASANGDTIPAYTISDLLALRDWDGADLIKCVSEGVQVDVLTHSDRAWAERAVLVVTKPPKGVWPNVDDEDRLLAAFPDNVFEQIRNENMILGFRRRSAPATSQPHVSRAIPLVPTSPGLRPIQLTNINDRFGFYKFGSAGLNLEPNQAGMPVASVTWRLDLERHHAFRAHVSSGPSPLPSAEVIITLTVRDQIAKAARVDERLSMKPATELRCDVTFGPLSGPHDVTISVEPAAPHAGNEQIPWVRIVDARFL
jgi:FkbM family methyltransferase